MAIEKDVIYRKSGRGMDAISTRPGSLSSAHRNLLILVDGKRSFDELATLWSVLGDTHEALGVLLALGFIEPTAARVAPEPIRVQPSAAAAQRGPGATELLVPLQHAQEFATARLLDLLGAEGNDLCQRLRATRSPREFRAALRRTETSLREVIGHELAERFLHQVENLRAP